MLKRCLRLKMRVRWPACAAFIIALGLSTVAGGQQGSRLAGVRAEVRDNPPGTVADEDQSQRDRNRREQRQREQRQRGRNCGRQRWLRDRCSPPSVGMSFFIDEADPVANSIVEEELGLPATVPFDEVQYHDDTLSESAAERLAGRALEADPFESWFWRPSFYVGGDFDSLRVAGLAVQLQQPGGLGIAAEASHWRESWPGGTDHLWLGDANLLFEAVATERFRFRLGAGLNWLQDSGGGDSGMNLTAAADYRITPGWIVSGEADFGNLGASDLLHWKLLSSLAIRRAELYLGYDRYQIGTASLGAVISGVRWNF